jgi:long-chain fatty acid transport protein
MRKPQLGSFTLFAISGLLVLASAERARASGFHIDEQDARSTARGGAVTANPTNASAIYYNPAGIGDLTGLHIDLGASMVAPTAKFQLAATGADTEAADKVFFLPQAYLSYRITPLVGVGLGFNAPFGLSLSWPESSPGRTVARDVELRTYFITPTVGLNLSRWVPGLSFGAGLDLVPASVRLTRDILFGTDVGSVALGASAFGVGGRAGLLYRPQQLDKWSFGLTYRSPVKLNFNDGDVDFDAPPAYRASLPPDSHGGSTSLTLPQTLDLGIAFDPIPGWEIEVDGNWIGWSSFKSLTLNIPGAPPTVSPKNWNDSFTVRVGTEYTIKKKWSGRLGFVWDQTPVPASTLDFLLPDLNRIDLAAGLGAALASNVRVDLGVLWVLPKSRATSNSDPNMPPVKGTYDVNAWVVGLSVGIALDRARTTAVSRAPEPATEVTPIPPPPPIEPATRSGAVSKRPPDGAHRPS